MWELTFKIFEVRTNHLVVPLAFDILNFRLMSNNQYHVKWAAIAERDLKQIIDYIAIDPGNALEIFKKIKQTTSHLYNQPKRGWIVPELQDQGVQIYRELIVAPWRIIYRISDTTVYILSIIDARRNVEDILLDRLVK